MASRLPWLARLATLACLLLLLAPIAEWGGKQLLGASVQFGERIWPDYAQLRREPVPPGPAPEPPAPEPADQKNAKLDDILEGEDVKSADVLAQETHAALQQAHAADTRAYEDKLVRRTTALQTYSAAEARLEAAATWLGAHLLHILVLLLGLCGVLATLKRAHISLIPPNSRREDRFAQSASLVANLLLLASVYEQWRLADEAGSTAADLGLSLLWMAAFAAMAVTNGALLIRADRDEPSDAHPAAAALAIPLYCIMALLAGAYFLVFEHYLAGLAVYLEKLLQNAHLYLQVGLYVWAGMLLKRTVLPEGLFDVLRPWRLSPEALVVVTVLLAAIPTAYSGASGIFVIAVGATLYRELRGAGARQSLALAATAMSGSMGVVLAPCLLVVIIGYLTGLGSAELFGWGRYVFLLSGALFAALVFLTRDRREPEPRSPTAAEDSARAARKLLPHALVLASMIALCWFGLGTGINELTAAYVLPVMMLIMLRVERRGLARSEARSPDMTVLAATAEATHHIGALLLLMALSAGLGGVIERSELMTLLPESFATPWLAMAVLVVVLVLIGMVMDPYGAVILVHATFAKVATDSGIDPIHFWMVVLVAFELGYLTPPVALNHILARHVTRVKILEPEPGASWWQRHERLLLPISVLGTTLLLVAFVPLLWR